LNRLATDGSAITATPVVAANTLVVVTRKGAVMVGALIECGSILHTAREGVILMNERVAA